MRSANLRILCLVWTISLSGIVLSRKPPIRCLLVHFRDNVKHEARLTGSARSMQDWGCVSGESFEVGAGQPLLSMRLFGLFESYFRSSCAPRKR